MRLLAGELSMLCWNKLLDAAAVIIMEKGQEPSQTSLEGLDCALLLCCRTSIAVLHTLARWPCQVLGASRSGLTEEGPPSLEKGGF